MVSIHPPTNVRDNIGQAEGCISDSGVAWNLLMQSDHNQSNVELMFPIFPEVGMSDLYFLKLSSI